jgi:hypothetical protein
MSEQLDQLYELLPVVYRQRDAGQGYPLRALLQVIAEQVNVVEADVAQLYDNWFIETCEDWVVPYIGDLIGYRPVHEAGEPGDPATLRERLRNKILIPRREVANTIGYRRRKGTLALLELLANDVARWPARAVEFYNLLGWTQALNHLRLARGRTVDLRRGDALELLNGPFDELAHTVDVRRANSRRTQGRYNVPSVGLFIWRLKAYSVTRTPAYCVEAVGDHCYTFSVLGNDTPLYTRAEPEAGPAEIAGEMNLPVPIRRRALEARKTDYYGENKSLYVWRRDTTDGPRQPIPPEEIVAADLTDWQYEPHPGQVAVDPQLGRIAFRPGEWPRRGVWVSYQYGFSADVGGGEYMRSLSQPGEHTLYRVGPTEELKRINEALARWEQDRGQAGSQQQKRLRNAIIEIADSGVYVEQINVELEEGQSLQIRAANGTRPVIRLLDWHTDLPDDLSVAMAPGSRFILDGLLVTGRGVQVREKQKQASGQGEPKAQSTTEAQGRDLPASVTIRHTTLVPGWALDPDCEPWRPSEPSLELIDLQATVTIEHSIVGSIQVNLDAVRAEPIPIHIRDSILDATGADCDDPRCEAVGAPGWPLAHAVLTVARSTVFGRVYVHAIDLAENSIFMGRVRVARRQRGCMRFCYVVTPGSRTPRRYHCQPDLVERPTQVQFEQGDISEDEKDRALERERLRVHPQFNSARYGTPTYCQLAATCAGEIKRGADDESEMGVFHDLYQPQRAANLRARLEEYTPAGMEAGIIYAS